MILDLIKEFPSLAHTFKYAHSVPHMYALFDALAPDLVTYTHAQPREQPFTIDDPESIALIERKIKDCEREINRLHDLQLFWVTSTKITQLEYINDLISTQRKRIRTLKGYLPKKVTSDLKPLIEFAHTIDPRVILNTDKTNISCPFHTDKTPSFKIYKDHVHCFSCGFHGDQIALVQKLHDLNFKEALTHINSSYA